MRAVIDGERLKNILRIAATAGFSAGAALKVADTSAEFRAFFEQYLARGDHADLAYLEGPQRFDLRSILPGAQTLLLFRYPYRFHEVDAKLRSAPYKIARYAWQKDYHVTLKAKLADVMQRAQVTGRAVTDSAPLAERYWGAPRRSWQNWPQRHADRRRSGQLLSHSCAAHNRAAFCRPGFAENCCTRRTRHRKNLWHLQSLR